MEDKHTEIYNNRDSVEDTLTEKYSRSSTSKDLRRYFREYCDHSSINGFIYLSEKRSRVERY